MRTGETRRSATFTLLELMFVILILGLLYQTVTPMYKKSVIRARESALKQDLFLVRQAIDLYYREFQRYPDSLDALVRERYLRSLPIDPFTLRQDGWLTVPSKEGENDVFDLHSGSGESALDGTPYQRW